jgi:hypothetical protein
MSLVVVNLAERLERATVAMLRGAIEALKLDVAALCVRAAKALGDA